MVPVYPIEIRRRRDVFRP